MKPFLLSVLTTLLCPAWLAAAATKALPQLDQAAAPIARGFTIFLIGDSTMANKPLIPENSERGWGQMPGIYFQAGVRVENHALNGRSSKSFREEGHWGVVQHRIKPGDWVIMQFGHVYIYVSPGEYGTLPKGRQDDTHFCAFGASRMCDLAVAEMPANVPELARYLNAPRASAAK